MGAKIEDGPDEEADDVPPPLPESSDPVIKAITDHARYVEMRMDRMEKKFDERMQAIEDEGDPWLRHLADYLKKAYARYFEEKITKCN